jgi:hypothetical protein
MCAAASSRFRSERGSAVITVLLLAAVTALIASSLLFRAVQESRLATRSVFQSVALNLAEAGIEEGLHAANTGRLNAANGWALAAGATADYVKTVSGFILQQASGSFYVRVDQGNTMTPIIIAAGVVAIPGQPRIVKQLRVTATKRSLWANGIVAKDTVTFSGNVTVDSYDSSLGAYNASTNRSDQATVATLRTSADPIVLNSNASIFGYVATGGQDPTVGAGGRIYGLTTPSGTLVDQSRIRRDFSANLPDVAAPTGSAYALGDVKTSLTLPRTGDVAGSNGRYLYAMTSLQLAGTDVVTVLGPVDVIVSGKVTTAGNAALTVGSATVTTATLNLYVAGQMDMQGNGVVNNTNVPASMSIWGTVPSTSTSKQDIKIGGNGTYTGVVYAPNAAVNFTAKNGVFGAIVSNQTSVGGNGAFHYDVRLGAIIQSLDIAFRTTSWAELSQAPTSGSPFARDARDPFPSLF